MKYSFHSSKIGRVSRQERPEHKYELIQSAVHVFMSSAIAFATRGKVEDFLQTRRATRSRRKEGKEGVYFVSFPTWT